METLDLFEAEARDQRQRLGPAAMVLRGFALPYVQQVLPAIEVIGAMSPFRHMVTPGIQPQETELLLAATSPDPAGAIGQSPHRFATRSAS